MSHVDTEWVEAALDEAAPGWKHRGEGWVVPAAPGCPHEVTLHQEAGGVRVAAVLASFDAIDDTQRQAVERYLGRATPHGELRAGSIVLAIALQPEEGEARLAEALARVRAGAAQLSREANALLLPEVAAAYLRFLETPLAPERI